MTRFDTFIDRWCHFWALALPIVSLEILWKVW